MATKSLMGRNHKSQPGIPRLPVVLPAPFRLGLGAANASAQSTNHALSPQRAHPLVSLSHFFLPRAGAHQKQEKRMRRSAGWKDQLQISEFQQHHTLCADRMSEGARGRSHWGQSVKREIVERNLENQENIDSCYREYYPMKRFERAAKLPSETDK